MTQAPSAAVTRLQPFGGPSERDAVGSRAVIDLGQATPGWVGPAAMHEIAREQVSAQLTAPALARGLFDLRAAICEDRAANFDLEYDPSGEALVTAGATEAIAATLLGLVEPGSEVILIEPYYDAYAAAVALAGAQRVSVPLVRDAAGFALDVDALRAAVTENTAMIVVNTPHNPTGHVFSPAELAAVAELAVERDLIVLADEVFERITFDAPHVPMASLPGMESRTVTIGSAAKTFNVAGWRIGWALASRPLLDGVLTAKRCLTSAGGSPFQPAVAHALRHERDWVDDLRVTLRGRRDRLTAALSEAGFAPFRSAGTYFVCADADGFDAAELCRDLMLDRGVSASTLADLVDRQEPWRSTLRFAFSQRDEVLAEGISRLIARV